MNIGNFHFIGIGGAGMSGIARILLSKGAHVSGSDLKNSLSTDQLKALGAKIFIGHSASNVGNADVVVVSTAIDQNNPELVASQKSGITIMHRAQALAFIMSDLKALAVAGTHGKTTTTSMLTIALQSAGLDPSFSIGGMINATGTNAHHGSGDFFVAEADESDGSFLAYQPFGGIITNIELDHVDHFANQDEIDEVFLQFVRRFQPVQSGEKLLVVCGDDDGIQRLIPQLGKVIRYGTNLENDYVVDSIELGALSSRGRVLHRGKAIAHLELRIPGQHNLVNALAVVALCNEINIPLTPVVAGLSTFTGSRRRFEIKGEVRGIRVVDDYGHHPTELEVTLEAARRFAGAGRLITIFQPHRYSRTQKFARDFTHALSAADKIYVLDIYAASEKPIQGVSGKLITESGDNRFIYQPSLIQVVESVVAEAEPGDVIITMGAGDVTSLGPAILSALEDRFEQD